MALTTAERNRRKRERKKQEREERRKEEEDERKAKEQKPDEHVEIEYVSEAVQPAEAMETIMRRFQQRAAVVTDDEKVAPVKDANEIGDHDADDNDGDKKPLSKRKLRELIRPSVAELKRRVKHPDLVEAHDVTGPDPDFLIELKAVPGTVPVPRHWGRKRKYLQGKRGFEKQPFQLPDFIVKTGITAMRDTLAEEHNKMSQKEKSRARVAPKMGAVDIDYRTLYDSFSSTKPPGNLMALVTCTMREKS
jgi:splicing factor 3B subunit 2